MKPLHVSQYSFEPTWTLSQPGWAGRCPRRLPSCPPSSWSRGPVSPERQMPWPRRRTGPSETPRERLDELKRPREPFRSRPHSQNLISDYLNSSKKQLVQVRGIYLKSSSWGPSLHFCIEETLCSADFILYSWILPAQEVEQVVMKVGVGLRISS